MSSSDPIKDYGFTALPRDGTTLVKNKPTNNDPATPTTVSLIPLPVSSLASAVLAYAKKELPEKVFNHSMRVYYYGTVPLFNSQGRNSASSILTYQLRQTNLSSSSSSYCK